VFFARSLELLGRKGVAFCMRAKKRKRVWNRLKRKEMALRKVANSRMGTVGIHPAFFRKSVEVLDGEGVMKHSWCKERKE
jgi:hypothetical protein